MKDNTIAVFKIDDMIRKFIFSVTFAQFINYVNY